MCGAERLEAKQPQAMNLNDTTQKHNTITTII